MRLIKTYENLAINSGFIAMIQSVIVNCKSDEIIEIPDDETDYDVVEFGIIATTVYGEEFILAVYATEEECDYARYKLENWLISGIGNYYTITERK